MFREAQLESVNPVKCRDSQRLRLLYSNYLAFLYVKLIYIEFCTVYADSIYYELKTRCIQCIQKIGLNLHIVISKEQRVFKVVIKASFIIHQLTSTSSSHIPPRLYNKYCSNITKKSWFLFSMKLI